MKFLVFFSNYAATCKDEKYAGFDGRYIFEPITIETVVFLTYQLASFCFISV